MPAAITNGRLLKKCETCAGPAQHGYGVNLAGAIKAQADGNIKLAQKHLGKWYCTQHNLKAA